MKRPVVIVNPISSGIELAPAFKARGIPVIAVTFKPLRILGFGSKVQTSDFNDVIPVQPHLGEVLRKYNPLAIIPGSESGVPLAESLAILLTPQFANDPLKISNRLHKGQMQEALHKAGVMALKTLNTSSEASVEEWIKENHFVGSPLVIKPPISSGSENVFHIPEKGDWKQAFRRVLSIPSTITGKISATAIIQEQAIGFEYAVGTVSANGRHYLSHLIKYNKTSSHGCKTIFDYVEFLPFSHAAHGELLAYTHEVLNALGVRWGASHTEIILTQQGPRLIESSARMIGGPTVGFSRVATGSSQADKLVEVYLDGDVQEKVYKLKNRLVPVFLRSPASGVVINADVFDDLANLPTLLAKFIWFQSGDRVPQTVDYLSSIGIIALVGERESIFRDYQTIRQMESNLLIKN